MFIDKKYKHHTFVALSIVRVFLSLFKTSHNFNYFYWILFRYYGNDGMHVCVCHLMRWMMTIWETFGFLGFQMYRQPHTCDWIVWVAKQWDYWNYIKLYIFTGWNFAWCMQYFFKLFSFHNIPNVVRQYFYIFFLFALSFSFSPLFSHSLYRSHSFCLVYRWLNRSFFKKKICYRSYSLRLSLTHRSPFHTQIRNFFFLHIHSRISTYSIHNSVNSVMFAVCRYGVFFIRFNSSSCALL